VEWEERGRTELAAGDTLGDYVLEERLGEGGMGLVFRAQRTSDGETVAVKVMKLDLLDDETSRRRFLHEARAAADVRHQCLVPIHDVGEVEGRLFIVVAYVAGPALDVRIRDEGTLTPAETVVVAHGIGSALDALHERGIVHRDVKASNVLLDDGTPMLTDFGLAKGSSYTVLTQPGQVLGTLEYMAPELIKGAPATPASDIYALGCLVYQCVAGKTPFGDRSVFEVGIAHLDEEPAPPGDRPILAEAVLTALRKEPSERPASGTEYAAAVERAVGDS
jgi:serine/threonine-protein kinase